MSSYGRLCRSFVSRITQNVMKGFWWNILEGLGMEKAMRSWWRSGFFRGFWVIHFTVRKQGVNWHLILQRISAVMNGFWWTSTDGAETSPRKDQTLVLRWIQLCSSCMKSVAFARWQYNSQRKFEISINQSKKCVLRLLHSPERQGLTIKTTRSKQFNKSTVKPRKLYDKN